MMISIVPLSRGDAHGEKRGELRGMFTRFGEKTMDTPLAEGTPFGKSLRRPAEDFILNT
jgi:hypothetical protein